VWFSLLWSLELCICPCIGFPISVLYPDLVIGCTLNKFSDLGSSRQRTVWWSISLLQIVNSFHFLRRKGLLCWSKTEQFHCN
jgi:hypothetical protein